MCLSSERHLGLWLWWFLRALASLTECSLGASSLESHKDSWQAAVKCINGKKREQVVGPMQVSFLMLCPQEDRWSVDTSRKQGVCTLLWNSKYASCSLFLTSDIVEDKSTRREGWVPSLPFTQVKAIAGMKQEESSSCEHSVGFLLNSSYTVELK